MSKFEEMGFTPGVIKAIDELGFIEPMPVQKEVIPLMLGDERDIIVLAQTGTGKTAAFGLPLVQTTDSGNNRTQALILCPTRELCRQIESDLSDYSRFTGNLKILAVYGGASIDNQIRGLKKGVHIIVATPGRLIDLIDRGSADLSSVSTLILDEADEMLNMGFLDSIKEIMRTIPYGRRTLLFSATMPAEIETIARKYMTDPAEVIIGKRNSSAENVTHNYYLVHARDKYRVLKRIADYEPDIYGIIFCRTRKDTQEIATRLINDGYNADALHGDLSQSQRDAVMNKFRNRNLQLLVATDVAARGLDVDDLTHVINYALPEDPEVYTHRSGRTGRAGKNGISISLVHLREKNLLQQIERKIKKGFKLIPVPSGSEICSKQLFHWVGKLEKTATNHREIEKLFPDIEKKLEGLDRKELLKRVVAMEFDRFLNDYGNDEEPLAIDEKENNSGGDTKRGKINGNSSTKYSRLFINLGKKDGFYPEQLIELINKNTSGKKIPLGKIDLMKTFSFFEVEEKNAVKLIDVLKNVRFMNRNIVVEYAQAKTGNEINGRSYRPEKRQGNRSDRKKYDKSRVSNRGRLQLS
jgi:ATP-dependent RNA helicase DeaD